MNNKIALILSLVLLLIACENQENEFKNVDISKVVQDIKFYDSYSNIKQLLEDKYQLKYDREIVHEEKDKNVYIFSGGRINDIKTKSWSVVFDNDSLNSILITIESESENIISSDLQKLKDVIINLSIDKYYEEDEFWIINVEKEEKYGIQLSSNSRAIIISFSSEKYINKYSSI